MNVPAAAAAQPCTLEPVEALLQHARDALGEGRHEEARAFAQQALDHAVDEGHIASAGALLCKACFVLGHMGNPWQPERLLEGALQLPAARASRREMAIVPVNLSAWNSACR